MADPFRGEICAAWLDYLAEQSPEDLQEVMYSVAALCPASEIRDRTASVYLPDLVYANAPDAQSYVEDQEQIECQ